MKKFLITIILIVGFIHPPNVFAEVVWGDKTKPNGITEDNWAKYKDVCKKEIKYKYRTYPGKLPKSFMDHALANCVNKKVGIVFKKKNGRGWHPNVPQKFRGKAYLKPWDPKNPRAFNAYQYCLGRSRSTYKFSCTNWKERNYKRKADCIIDAAQQEERVKKCIVTYRYWVKSVEKCWPGFYWDWDEGKKYQWLLPAALMGKGTRMLSCVHPLSKIMVAAHDCYSNIRCKKACRADMHSVSFTARENAKVRTNQDCVNLCEKYFRDNIRTSRMSRKYYKCPFNGNYFK